MSDSPRLVPDPPASAARFGDGGDYYRPGLATREPELVLAVWFFLAAEEELPEVRASLRSEVYERLPEDGTDVYLWRNKEDRWRLYEDDWAPPSWAVPPAGSFREAHPMLEAVTPSRPSRRLPRSRRRSRGSKKLRRSAEAPEQVLPVDGGPVPSCDRGPVRAPGPPPQPAPGRVWRPKVDSVRERWARR